MIELKAYKGDVYIPVYGSIADAKVYLKKDVDEAIIQLEQKLENVQATAYTESVDAGIENRRLKRALWLARAERAKDRQTYYTHTRGDGWVHKVDQWIEVERKCLNKAEEYK